MGTVTSLGEHTGQSCFWTPRDMLQDVIKEIDEGIIDANKCLVIHLRDAGDDYTLGHSNAGMTRADMLALVEAFKYDVLQDLFPLEFVEE